MEATKPEVQLTGTDGNVFAVIGQVRKALKKAGQTQQAEEFVKKAFSASSYDEVLQLCLEYCEVN